MMNRIVVAIATLVGGAAGGAACIGGTTQPPNNRPPVFVMPSRPTCATQYELPDIVGTIGEGDLVEVSGIAASPVHHDVLWMQADAPEGQPPTDDTRLYAVSTSGDSLGSVLVEGAAVVDAEDLAAAPCPDLVGACLYLADTGDNNEPREQAQVIVVREPDVDVDAPLAAGAKVRPLVRYRVAWADGAANVEAMAVRPNLAAIVFFEKVRDEDARVFELRAPWTADALVEVPVVARIPTPGDGNDRRAFTGAAMHPSGDRLLLRTLEAAFEIDLTAVPDRDPARLDVSSPIEVMHGPADEPQGEAVTYDEAGTGFFAVSESPTKVPGQPLHHVACAP